MIALDLTIFKKIRSFKYFPVERDFVVQLLSWLLWLMSIKTKERIELSKYEEKCCKWLKYSQCAPDTFEPPNCSEYRGEGGKSDRFADHLEFVKLVILEGQCLVLTMFTIRRIKEERVLWSIDTVSFQTTWEFKGLLSRLVMTGFGRRWAMVRRTGSEVTRTCGIFYLPFLSLTAPFIDNAHERSITIYHPKWSMHDHLFTTEYRWAWSDNPWDYVEKIGLSRLLES